nr:hypothetical protein [Gammaproteobacteria bacterium]
MALSRRVVSNLGLPQVNAVAPPYGGLGTTYSAAQLIQLQKAGVHTVEGCYGGLNELDQPVALLRRIPISESRLPAEEAAGARRLRSRHGYFLGKRDLIREPIVAELEDIFDRFGFDRPRGNAPAAPARRSPSQEHQAI